MCQGKTICSLVRETIVCRKGLILSNLAKGDIWGITERFEQMQSESLAFWTFVSNVSDVSDGTLGTLVTDTPLKIGVGQIIFMRSGARQRMNYCWRILPLRSTRAQNLA
jgi:hypothetical protein